MTNNNSQTNTHPTSMDQSEFFQKLLENPNISKLPNHLKRYIVDQNFVAYTAIDHSVWRYVLRQNHRFLIDHAHEIYFEGLEKTGLKVEAIPSIQEMNEILIKIGWAAVSVDGFIPPAAFMEFQAHRVLVIAADMRQIHHIEYTPSPDIIHEAAGHAPVIADQDYAEYLRQFGEVGSRAMSSQKDFELYEAIRKLSILKEARDANPEEIAKAEKDVLYKQENLGEPSEMALLSRLHWWTVEYGLIGYLNKPKIYGAGLLSSIGEAATCLFPEIKKIPYDLNAQNYPFDITTMQPHLFVTPDFVHLINVLKEFSNTMAYKVGGLIGINKALECKRTSTCVYSSGLQLSGRFAEVLTDHNNNPIYIKTDNKSNLAYNNKELPGHGIDIHPIGFGSPVGLLKSSNKSLEDFSNDDLESNHMIIGSVLKLEYQSGITIEGVLTDIIRKEEKIILMSIDSNRVKYEGKYLNYNPGGIYHLAIGEKITSVFCGAADKDAYIQPSKVSKTRVIKYTLTAKENELNNLYQDVRDCRAGKKEPAIIPDIWERLKSDHPEDWLLPVELLEVILSVNSYPEIEKEINNHLEKMVTENKELKKLIEDGIYLAYNPENYRRTWKT
jgi:phenylalanine-4-hydroxylase